MNFIKTSKFSVKGIDTTRYILNEVRNLLISERGRSPRSDFSPKSFSGSLEGVISNPLN